MCDGVGDAAMDFRGVEDGDVDPWRECGEAVRGAVVVEDERAGLCDGAGGTGDSELVVVVAGAVVLRFHGEAGGSKLAADAVEECGVAVAAELMGVFQEVRELGNRVHGLAVYGGEVARENFCEVIADKFRRGVDDFEVIFRIGGLFFECVSGRVDFSENSGAGHAGVSGWMERWHEWCRGLGFSLFSLWSFWF